MTSTQAVPVPVSTGSLGGKFPALERRGFRRIKVTARRSYSGSQRRVTSDHLTFSCDSAYLRLAISRISTVLGRFAAPSFLLLPLLAEGSRHFGSPEGKIENDHRNGEVL